MNQNLNVRHRPKQHGLVFSIILILAGVVFLGVNTGFLPTEYKPLFFSWPIWVIFVGLYSLLNRSFHNAFFLLTIGIFFIIPQVGQSNPALGIPVDFTHLYWPALLIIAGIYIALSRLFWPSCFHHSHYHEKCKPNRWCSYNKWENEDGLIHVSSSFESRKNIVLDPVFKGGDVECNFGEIILDLRKTTLPEGKTKLYIKISFGSIVIILPDGWNIEVRGESMFGNFNDDRISPSYNPNDIKTLVIDGKCSFGECKLRD